ncbi:hypothetical protein Ait01nite_076410 [Actinoplanes italicus]|nr:hypothetical protein Ait01nite_076410 [Actinoplanes italicus]
MSSANATVTTAALSRKIRQNRDNRCVSSNIPPILDCLPGPASPIGTRSVHTGRHPFAVRLPEQEMGGSPHLEWRAGPMVAGGPSGLDGKPCRNEWEVPT